MTIEKSLYAKGLSKSTVKHYYKSTLQFIAWLDAQGIEAEHATNTDVMAYLQHLQKAGQANITRSIHLNILKHFFDYQIEQEHRTTNPAQHIKIRGSKRKTLYPILSKEGLENIYQNYHVPEMEDERKNRNWFKVYQLSKQRNKTILGLMIWQGLTTPEVNKMQLNDVKLKEGKIHIAGSRKSAERLLELKPQQIIELMEYQFTTRNQLLNYSTDKTPSTLFYIGVPPTGKQNSTSIDIVNVWKRLTQEVQEKHPQFINFKQVRTSVITHWLGKYNLRQVQYMAGHKYVSTTEGYQINQLEDLKTDIEKYHPF